MMRNPDSDGCDVAEDTPAVMRARVEPMRETFAVYLCVVTILAAVFAVFWFGMFPVAG